MTDMRLIPVEVLAKLKARQGALSRPPAGSTVNFDLKAAMAAYSAARSTASRAKAEATRADEISVKVKELRAQKGSRVNSHPKVSVARALKKFMDLRDFKIAKQTLASKERKLTAGDHLMIAQKARLLAERLSDPDQVSAYIRELTQEGDAHSQSHREKLGEVIDFWYGPAGLSWLAWQKDMDPKDWSEYTDFMDAAAIKAHDGGSQWTQSFLERATLEYDLETDRHDLT